MNAKDVSEALGRIDDSFVTEAVTYTPKKRNFWLPIAAAAACLFLLIGLLPPGLGAMSASPTGQNGTEAYYGEADPLKGLVITGDTESVVLQNLRITMDLIGSPLYNDKISGNTATMEYTFHNPTGEPIALTLTLPCGQDPHYAGSFEYETGTSLFDATRHLYTAMANGEALDLSLRLTGNNIPPAVDEQWSIGLFTDDTPVTAFTYEIQALESRDNAHISIRRSGLHDSIVLYQNEWVGTIITTSTPRYFNISLGERITLYVFGDATDFNPGWHFFADYTRKQSISGAAELISTQQMTFREYAAQSWDITSGVTLSDWAHVLATQIHRSSIDGFASVVNDYTLPHRWFQYDLNLEPGETVVNTVTMPVYPDVMLSNGGQWLCCNLDTLSMRLTQPQNGPEIILNTPFTMTESSEEFTQTETGYALDMTQIYKVVLDFTLEAVPVSTQKQSPVPNWNLFPVVFLCVSVGSLLLILYRANRKHAKE